MEALGNFLKSRQVLVKGNTRGGAGNDQDFLVREDKCLQLLQIETVRADLLNDLNGGPIGDRQIVLFDALKAFDLGLSDGKLPACVILDARIGIDLLARDNYVWRKFIWGDCRDKTDN